MGECREVCVHPRPSCKRDEGRRSCDRLCASTTRALLGYVSKCSASLMLLREKIRGCSEKESLHVLPSVGQG